MSEFDMLMHDRETTEVYFSHWLKDKKDGSGLIVPPKTVSNVPPVKEINTLLVEF